MISFEKTLFTVNSFYFLGLIISLGLIYIFVIGNVLAEDEHKRAKGNICIRCTFEIKVAKIHG